MLLHTAACLVHTSQAQALLRMTAGTILSFIFLNAGYPLLSLPLFLIILRRLPGMHEGNSALPPAMHLSGIPESCRTLLVMPRILQTQQDALSAAREASTLLHACAQENVDLLLLGDFGSTQWTHHDDSSVIATALASLDALSDSYPDTRILYLQRSRTQNSQSFAGSSGYLSAIRCVCQLIAQGEACDTFVYASFDPSCLHRSRP